MRRQSHTADALRVSPIRVCGESVTYQEAPLPLTIIAFHDDPRMNRALSTNVVGEQPSGKERARYHHQNSTT